jgi:PKD repeat protein
MLSLNVFAHFAFTSPRARRAASRCTLTVGLLAMLGVLSVAPALATSGSYGEVARFGGFDSSAYNSGHYGGTPTPGKFLDPTGFAVDTDDTSAPDNTALYVVDRTSGDQGATTSWRLQKLDDQGNVLASTSFTLPNEGAKQTAIAGLAVEDSGGGGRVYALVEGNDAIFTEYAYAKELLAWATAPSGKALVAAASLPPDPLGSTGGLVSSEAQLVSSLKGEHALYDPQGIAIDVAGGEHDVAIEATDGKGISASGIGDIPGIAGVWQVATAAQPGHATGELLGSWSASSLVAPADEDQAAPYGISTNPDGSLNVLIANINPAQSSTDVIKLSADLSSATVLLASEDVPLDTDRSPSYIPVPPGPFAGRYVAQAPWAAPGVIQLSEGFYASDFEISGGPDNESPTGVNYYWTQASTVTGKGNVGVRVLRPTAGGRLSDQQGGTILDTLGGGECELEAESESLIAGTKGSLWVLGRGLDTANWIDSGSSGAGDTVGREIVELAPGSGKPCPQPSGGFSASKTQFTAGTTVHFNAEPVNLEHGVPFAYEWDLNGDTTDGPKHDGFELVNTLGLWPNEEGIEVVSWPPPTAEFKYTKAGTYTVRLRILSDYGVYEAPSQTLTVTPPLVPVAEFNVTTASPTAAQPVEFNASSSTAPTGSTIANYHWEWGDGTSEDDQSGAFFSHTYGAAGHYSVTLTIEDSEHRHSESFSKEVVVSASQSPPPPPPGKTTTTTTTTTTTGITPPPPDRSPTNVSPQASAATGGLKLALSCPASKASCGGTVQVKTASAIPAKAKKGKKKAKGTQLVLGSASFSLVGGAGQTLTIHLSSKGLALLKQSKTLHVLLVVSSHDSFGDPKTVTLSMTLRAPVKSIHHGKR